VGGGGGGEERRMRLTGLEVLGGIRGLRGQMV
jgi:hypothetical protein